ncbi:UDP-2,4-diacetamido-2,4,6-trideoxy-beta-L-altropyranose hydrolase [Psychrobacillus sp. PGGUH221]|uniref:UDP-2,4-diacetamido-2,4, 6-trideoxy-beta-L-altropyranose hydrolase n=1 Tax=Psychrobacillus sp. PGGUH221 TaxID=3020058 RepID=UPI0035C709DB
MKKVVIRTDASIEIGSGHVMRCLTIAHQLKKHDIDVCFMMREVPGNLIDYVVTQGFSNITSLESADLYIIDHYGIDEVWEKKLQAYTNKIMVIDDLANRPHNCDLLLDQNVVPQFETRYEGLVPVHCVQLLGPSYLIMRDEFIKSRQNMPDRTGKVKNLLIFMGGTDPTDETLKILSALQETTMNLETIHIVVGNGNVHKEHIQAICAERGFYYHCQIDYMAELMLQVDFCIGAGGSTTWERCYVGLPSSSTIVADNQRIATEYAARLGAVWNIGWHENITVATYIELLNKLSEDTSFLKQMSDKGLQLTASKGQPNPWLYEILEMIK